MQFLVLARLCTIHIICTKTQPLNMITIQSGRGILQGIFSSQMGGLYTFNAFMDKNVICIQHLQHFIKV